MLPGKTTRNHQHAGSIVESFKGHAHGAILASNGCGVNSETAVAAGELTQVVGIRIIAARMCIWLPGSAVALSVSHISTSTRCSPSLGVGIIAVGIGLIFRVRRITAGIGFIFSMRRFA